VDFFHLQFFVTLIIVDSIKPVNMSSKKGSWESNKKEISISIGVILVVIVIFVSLTLYSQNWPPAVVVESSSMQHGQNFVFGVINTGDIVGVKKVISFKDVVTYVVARESGYPIDYGEYGNVIVYNDYYLNELVIHRALFYVEGWQGDIPVIYGNDHPSWLVISGSTVTIYDKGFRHQTVVIDLGSYVGQTGFVTMGDNNPVADQQPGSGIDNSLVNMSQVKGVVFGYLPILGTLKLWIEGKTQYIPEQSNLIMAIILILLIAFAFYPSGKKEKNVRK